MSRRASDALLVIVVMMAGKIDLMTVYELEGPLIREEQERRTRAMQERERLTRGR